MPRRGGRKDNSDPPPTPSSLGGNAAARLPPRGTGQRAAGTGHGPPLQAGLLHSRPLAVPGDLHIAYTSQLRAWPDTGPETLGQAQRPVPAAGWPKHAGLSCTQADGGPCHEWGPGTAAGSAEAGVCEGAARPSPGPRRGPRREGSGWLRKLLLRARRKPSPPAATPPLQGLLTGSQSNPTTHHPRR